MHSILDLRHRTVKDNLDAGRCVGKTLERGKDLGRVPTVHLLLFSPDEREISLRKQLTQDVLAKGLANPSGRDVFISFFRSNPDLLRETPEEFLERVKAGPGYEQFISILLADLRDHEKELKRAGVEIRYTREPFIMRVWMQDSEQAAPSITAAKLRSHSRRTIPNYSTISSKYLSINGTLCMLRGLLERQSKEPCNQDQWPEKRVRLSSPSLGTQVFGSP